MAMSQVCKSGYSVKRMIFKSNISFHTAITGERYREGDLLIQVA